MAYTSKLPAHRGCFSYARIPQAGGGVVYRLFRRDQRGALHWFLRAFQGTDRAAMAVELRRARRLLRDQVDEVDLMLMGVS